MLGIDVSSRSLTTALWPRGASSPVWEKEVPNTPAGIDQLLSFTQETFADVPWVVEPTGRYSLLVVQRAREAGRCVLLAPPRQAKLYLASVQTRAKTDKLDGRGLALFGHSRALAPYPIKSETVDQIDQLLSARKGLSRALSSLKLQAQSLPKAREALRPAIEGLTERIKVLDKEIARLAASSAEFAVTSKLRQVPGIGPVTAASLASRLSAKQFSHPDQLVAYIGLDVAVRQSGQRKGELGLTRQGDAELRRLLFVCAKATLRAKDNPFKSQYERERNKGLSTTAALCAVARKIACVCWSLHKHNADYDPERVGRPPGQTEQKTDQ